MVSTLYLEHVPVLETERLILRAPNGSDFDAYRRFYEDAEASRFYGGPLRAEQAWKRLAQHIGHWQLRGYGIWMVQARTDGSVLGGCGLLWPEGWPRSELTWWLLAGARGNGFATEASRAVIQYALEQAGWDSVETHMDDNNVAAQRLVQRLGGRVIAREQFPDGKSRNIYLLAAQA